MVYLVGPGRANEHTEPHLVAGEGMLVRRHGNAELNRDSAVAIGEYLDQYRREFGTEVTQPVKDRDGIVVRRKPAHVWHCSLALEPGEGQLRDELWQAIAEDFMDGMDFTTAGSGRPEAPWVAVHHGLTKAGGDHIHIAASLVRVDGTKVSVHMDQPRAQKICGQLERKYGLRVLASRTDGTTMRGVKPAETARAARLGRPEPDRETLARTVRACATASTTEAEFVRACRREGLLVRPRYADGRTDVVTGYSVALRPVAGERPLFYGGLSLAKDLALPRLREQWTSTPQLATEAVQEWTAGLRGRRTVAGGRRQRQAAPSTTWEEQTEVVTQLRDQLRSVPIDDRHTWAAVAHHAAGVFAAWSRRTEPRPGPLAATADALARSAQLQYRLPRPAYTPGPALTGLALLVLHGTGPSGAGADLVMLRQLANTMKAIHDAHQARGEAARALVVERAARDHLATLLTGPPSAQPLLATGTSSAPSDGKAAEATGPSAAREPSPAALDQARGRPGPSAPGDGETVGARRLAAAAGTVVAAALDADTAAAWVSDPAWPALQARITSLIDHGQDAVAAVRLALESRELGTADSAVQVMTWRLDQLIDARQTTALQDSPRHDDPELAATLNALRAANVPAGSPPAPGAAADATAAQAPARAGARRLPPGTVTDTDPEIGD